MTESAGWATVLQRSALPVAMCFVLLPFAVALAGLVGLEWYPTSDQALMMLQIDAVGSSGTPLTGAWSRWGWDHPGPLLLWLLAPFTWVFGYVGMLVGMVTINAAAACGSLLVARRRGGRPLVIVVGALVVTFCFAQGPERLLDPWNPWAAVLPFLTFALLAWSVADGDLAAAPYLVVTGTFCVQVHLAYALLVTGLSATAGVLAWVAYRGTRASQRRGGGRSVIVATIVGLLLWLPPIVQQLFGDEGNLAAIVNFVRDPTEPAAGWQYAWGVLGTEVGLPGAWLSGGDSGDFDVRTSSALGAVIVLTVMITLGCVAARRGNRDAGCLAIIAATATALAVVSTSRVTGGAFSYVLRWWWVTTAIVWLSIAWSAFRLLPTRQWQTGAVTLAMGVLVTLSVGLSWQASPPAVPEPIASATVAAMSPDVSAALAEEGRVMVTWADRRGWGVAATGLILDLHRRGHDVGVPESYRPFFEADMVVDPNAVDAALVIVGEDDLRTGFVPPTAAVVIATYDPLSLADRDRVEALWDAVARQVSPDSGLLPSDVDGTTGRERLRQAGVSESALTELARLRAAGSAYTAVLTR
ncbi:MAG: hypothetical protein ACRDZ2_13630 [Ilumatobacteraceae bacterium]